MRGAAALPATAAVNWIHRRVSDWRSRTLGRPAINTVLFYVDLRLVGLSHRRTIDIIRGRVAS